MGRPKLVAASNSQSVDFLQLKAILLYNKNSMLVDDMLFFYRSTVEARDIYDALECLVLLMFLLFQYLILNNGNILHVASAGSLLKAFTGLFAIKKHTSK